MIRGLMLSAAAAITASTLIGAPIASAAPPGCELHPWGFLGTQTRQICDGPIQPDGSWMRRRVIGVPAHYVNASSTCSHSTYTSHCTYYPGGWVGDRITADETYPV